MTNLILNEASFKRGALITSIHLRRLGACVTQIKKFRREWPDGVRLLKRSIMRAVEIGLDVAWLVHNLSGEDEHPKFITLRRGDHARLDSAYRHYYDIPHPGKSDKEAWKVYEMEAGEILWRAINR